LLCLLCLLRPRPPCPPLFPYTTLFRSLPPYPEASCSAKFRDDCIDLLRNFTAHSCQFNPSPIAHGTSIRPRINQTQPMVAAIARSEEHTSELQSRENLVCRLLLEKKNQ